MLYIAPLYQPYPKTHTIDMVFGALDEILAPTFILKREYNRGRPRQCCTQDLKPMFRHEALDPLHPAYPSGHSTQTHTIALLLGKLVPSKQSALLLAAQEISRNREIAGLHYASDTAAGALLAKQLVDLLLASPFGSQLYKPATNEWP